MNNKKNKSKSTYKNKKWRGGYISSNSYNSKKSIKNKHYTVKNKNKKSSSRQTLSSSILAIQMNKGI